MCLYQRLANPDALNRAESHGSSRQNSHSILTSSSFWISFSQLVQHSTLTQTAPSQWLPLKTPPCFHAALFRKVCSAVIQALLTQDQQQLHFYNRGLYCTGCIGNSLIQEACFNHLYRESTIITFWAVLNPYTVQVLWKSTVQVPVKVHKLLASAKCHLS